MKKTIGIAVGLLLSSCSNPKTEVVATSGTSVAYPHQDTAPWPWVHVVPSERTLAFQEVDFEKIAHQIRFDISSFNHRNVYKKVRLILVDYTILPHEESSINAFKETVQGEIYAKKYESRPLRYMMTVSFYECNQKPPAPPTYEITASIRKNRAAPQEAMRLMARDAVEELHALQEVKKLEPGVKIKVNLD